MARHKEFDTTKAIEQARDLFWLQGYEATSIQDLVDHLGISRSSLYDTFEDKHSLFLLTLDQYGENLRVSSSRLQRRRTDLAPNGGVSSGFL